MYVYSCYFSPNDPFEVFETQILLFEESLSEAGGRCLIGGDFDSKSPEWGEARLDRRGILYGEMDARNDLIVLNQGKEFTLRRGAGGSIIDFTIAAPRLASKIGDLCVLKVIPLSDHRCIEFSLEQRCQAVDNGKGGEGRSPSWNTRRLCRERQPGSLMSLVGLSLLGHWRTLCARRGERWSRLATTRCLAASAGKPRVRCNGGTTSWRPYVVNASQRGEDSPCQRGMLRYTRRGKGQKQL